VELESLESSAILAYKLSGSQNRYVSCAKGLGTSCSDMLTIGQDTRFSARELTGFFSGSRKAHEELR